MTKFFLAFILATVSVVSIAREVSADVMPYYDITIKPLREDLVRITVSSQNGALKAGAVRVRTNNPNVTWGCKSLKGDTTLYSIGDLYRGRDNLQNPGAIMLYYNCNDQQILDEQLINTVWLSPKAVNAGGVSDEGWVGAYLRPTTDNFNKSTLIIYTMTHVEVKGCVRWAVSIQVEPGIRFTKRVVVRLANGVQRGEDELVVYRKDSGKLTQLNTVHQFGSDDFDAKTGQLGTFALGEVNSVCVQ